MKKKSRSRLILLAIFFVCALLVWFFWRDVAKWLLPRTEKAASGPTQKQSRETISEEDRKKLEEILKRR